MTHRARGVRALALGALCLLCWLLAVSALSQPARAADDVAARIVITSVSPDLVRADSTVRLTGTLTNTGAQTLEQVSVRLRAVRGRLGTRVDVDRWLSGDDGRQGVPVEPTADPSAPVPAGAKVTFTLAVPASALGLGGGEFGAYPIAVDARATPADGDRDQVALLRTTIQWQPAKKQYAAQRIAWVVPFTGLPGHSPTGTLSVAQVAAAIAPGQRLARLLAAGSAPGVAWAVDPQLLITLRAAAESTGSPTSTPSGTSSPTAKTPQSSTPGAGTAPGSTSASTTSPSTTSSAGPTSTTSSGADPRVAVREFLTAMRSAAVGREVIELPYADPDLQVLSDAGAMDLVTAARAAGAGTITEVLGVTPRSDIAWPAGGYASDRLAQDLESAGLGSLLLSAGSRPLVEALNYTPDARTTALPGGATALLYDPLLSALMSRLRGNDASARSRFLAETAAATTERPGLSRRLLVVLPRTLTPDADAFRSTVLAASTAPWLEPTSMDVMLDPVGARGDTSELARRAVPPADNRADHGIDAADVASTRTLRGHLSALGEVLSDPVRTTAELQRSSLGLLSIAWRGHRTDLAARQASAQASVDRLAGRLRVLPTTITFLRSEGELQLTIRNDFDQRVEGVRLRVVAPSPRLVVSREVSDPIALEPGTSASIRVPVRALASGEVTLQAQLVSPSGGTIGQVEEVRVRVRPTDSWVLTVGGAIVAIVLLVGVVRALRRPRRQARLSAARAAPDNDEDLNP